jgi:hypothetical protein
MSAGLRSITTYRDAGKAASIAGTAREEYRYHVDASPRAIAVGGAPAKRLRYRSISAYRRFARSELKKCGSFGRVRNT